MRRKICFILTSVFAIDAVFAVENVCSLCPTATFYTDSELTSLAHGYFNGDCQSLPGASYCHFYNNGVSYYDSAGTFTIDHTCNYVNDVLNCPSLSEIRTKLQKLVADMSDGEYLPEEIQVDANIMTDYGFDSLAVVELLATIEEEFDLRISPERVRNIMTVSDMALFLADNLC